MKTEQDYLADPNIIGPFASKTAADIYRNRYHYRNPIKDNVTVVYGDDYQWYVQKAN